jgi:hypothetical protein
MEIVTSFHTYFVSFLHGLLVSPTYIYVGVIALFFGLITRRLAGVIFVPVLATIIYLAVLTLAPVIVQHAELKPPVFDVAYAKLAIASYIVFLVLGAVVFAIKKLVLKLVG